MPYQRRNRITALAWHGLLALAVLALGLSAAAALVQRLVFGAC